MSDPNGLELFAAQLSPAVRADILAWRGDARLDGLYARVAASRTERTFLDSLAEAMTARHLQARGCRLEFEVPTPAGKTCDFVVTSEDVQFGLHIKRLDTERPRGRRLTISPRLRYLERIERPYVVKVRWHGGSTDAQMQNLVRSATEFIMRSRVGDELVVHDDDGTEIGGVLIVAPWQGPRVSLLIGLPSGFIDDTPRVRRLLRRAHRQFMPRLPNMILVCSSSEAERDDFGDALLGSHVERWDAFPPRGQRIAHGRAGDGFWHEHRYSDSFVAGWFRLALDLDRLDARIWLREGAVVRDELAAALDRCWGEAMGR